MNRFMAQFYQLTNGLTCSKWPNFQTQLTGPLPALKIDAACDSIFRSGMRPGIQIIEFLRAANDSVGVRNIFLSLLILILYERFLKFLEVLGSGIA
jgi:hypothetical protein